MVGRRLVGVQQVGAGESQNGSGREGRRWEGKGLQAGGKWAAGREKGSFKKYAPGRGGGCSRRNSEDQKGPFGGRVGKKKTRAKCGKLRGLQCWVGGGGSKRGNGNWTAMTRRHYPGGEVGFSIELGKSLKTSTTNTGRHLNQLNACFSTLTVKGQTPMGEIRPKTLRGPNVAANVGIMENSGADSSGTMMKTAQWKSEGSLSALKPSFKKKKQK